jgi:hypothetical protein
MDRFDALSWSGSHPFPHDRRAALRGVEGGSSDRFRQRTGKRLATSWAGRTEYDSLI